MILLIMQNIKLAKYVQVELQKGVPPSTIHTVLAHTGWQKEDVDSAFASVLNGDFKRAQHYMLLVWGITCLFVSSSLFAYIFKDFDDEIASIWFVTAAAGALIICGYVLMGIFELRLVYIKYAFLMILIFGLVGAITCVVNIQIAPSFGMIGAIQ